MSDNKTINFKNNLKNWSLLSTVGIMSQRKRKDEKKEDFKREVDDL